jgi:S-formylglutathione hydrolase
MMKAVVADPEVAPVEALTVGRSAAVAHFPVAADKAGITGHSMGGHGALTLALRHPGRYRSVSALAPIVAPTQVPWGQKAFAGYLGDDRAAWDAHDTCALLRAGKRWPGTALVDQGLADKFLDRELRPELLESAASEYGAPLSLRPDRARARARGRWARSSPGHRRRRAASSIARR